MPSATTKAMITAQPPMANPLAEKRTEIVSFRCPDCVLARLQGLALHNCMSLSEYCMTIVLEDLDGNPSECLHCQRGNGQFEELDQVITEIRRSVSDGRIDDLERKRLTRRMTAALDRLWNGKETGAA